MWDGASSLGSPFLSVYLSPMPHFPRSWDGDTDAQPTG